MGDDKSSSTETKEKDESKQEESKQDDKAEDDGEKDEGRPNEERVEEMDERLDKVGEKIEHARRDSEEAVHGSFYEGEEPMGMESGEESREDDREGADAKSDDQNIAPG